jgi:hypothetical protein
LHLVHMLMIINLTTGIDSFVWKWNTSGKFYVKSL